MSEIKSILDEARNVVSGARQKQYGPPEQSLEDITALWNAYLHGRCGYFLTPKDIAMMMVLLKIAREKHKSKKDNLVDAAGYLLMASKMEGYEPDSKRPNMVETKRGWRFVGDLMTLDER